MRGESSPRPAEGAGAAAAGGRRSVELLDVRGLSAGSARLRDAAAQAAEVLRRGEVVGIPTDTVYGLASDPCSEAGFRAVVRAKGRPEGLALPVLAADADAAFALAAEVPDFARRLAETFWPGGLTIVVRARPEAGLVVGGDGTTVGLRVSADPVAGAVAAALGAVTATSANPHGVPPLERADQVVEVLGPGVALVLDGGERRGTPSSVVDCSGERPRLLREGAVPWAAIARALSAVAPEDAREPAHLGEPEGVGEPEHGGRRSTGGRAPASLRKDSGR